jgi:uncharacterized protein (UPF0548 family)
VPTTLPLSRRLSTAARWPLGIGLTSWRYMWRTVPMCRTETAGEADADAPPLLPAGFDTSDVQTASDGYGPLYHRRYGVTIEGAELSPAELIEALRADLDAFAPSEFASFQRVDGDGPLSTGDEYVVRMPGPWDGPVRVVEAGEDSFRLATLDGHLEAGQIVFSAGDDLEFTIESWARSADRLSDLLYTRVRMAKEIQLHMWVSFLERVVKHSGGRRKGCISIETRRVEGDRRLERLRDTPLNFDRAEMREHPDRWQHDERVQPLPAEPPGAPVPGGSWALARRLMQGYEFADPSIVRADYDPEQPLEGRDMVLAVRVRGLVFRMGCRVTEVYERTGSEAGRDVCVWGWSYGTLRGHFESGEMSWEVLKWLDTGEVAFRLRSRSRRARDPNPIVRVGFRLFGRREQLHFYDSTCERMRRLVEEALRHDAEAVRRTSREMTTYRRGGHEAAHDRLARNVER